MNSILASAHTWFLESYEQAPYGDLIIRLVEGFKGKERLPVHVGEHELGYFFPVTIEPHSRCVSIVFGDLRSLLTYAEGYDAEDKLLDLEDGKYLRKARSSSFREFTLATSNALDEHRGDYSEWLVWSEDQIFQVLAGEPPKVLIESRLPDLSLERGQTWSAS